MSQDKDNRTVETKEEILKLNHYYQSQVAVETVPTKTEYAQVVNYHATQQKLLFIYYPPSNLTKKGNG